MTSPDLARVDELLFEPSGWFLIDSSNRRVPGVVAPSLGAGLGLLGRAGIAAVVGRLRDGVRVVDVDLEGARGDAAAEAVVAWCEREGLWSLVRPSGGSDGRAHVFVVHEGQLAALEAYVADLRAGLKAPAGAVDLRVSVRPLSSPHRSGVFTRPLGRLSEALTQLRRRLTVQCPSRGQEERERPREGVVALAPAWPRRRSTLPSQWQAYVQDGVAPVVGGQDQSRSAVELVATAALLRAGYDATAAWEAIVCAHPDAFTKARANKRRWVAWVWNAAVVADTAFQPVGEVDEDLSRDVDAARARLQALAWSLPPRRRPALLLVGHTVLDRLARTGSRRVPVPERDLVLDTGLSDRATIRTQLRALAGTVGVLHEDAFDPTKRAGSSFEFEIPSSHVGGVSQIHPPSLHTPYVTPGLWATLPRTCHQLWRALTSSTDAQRLEVLAQVGMVTSRPDEKPSPRQVRTTRDALTALARAGLTECTPGGQWLARAAPDRDHVQAAQQHRAELERVVAAERAEYRAPAGAWGVARAAALKANRAREVAWWGGLPGDERARRHALWQHRFAALSVAEQEHLKVVLADRRVRAGVDEGARHDQWLDSLTWHEYAHRAAARAAEFAALPDPLRQVTAAAWARHRARYGISQSTPLATSRREHAAALPGGPEGRDEQFWDAQQALPGLPTARGRPVSA